MSAEPTVKMTDEELALVLTPEEMAAIKAADDDDKGILAKIAGQGEGDDGDGDADGDGDDDGGEGEDGAGAAAAPDQAPSAAPAPDSAPAVAAAPAVEPDPVPAPQPVAYRVDLPADHDEKKAEAQAKLVDLKAKFKAGELEVDAYEAQRDAVSAELDTMRRAELKAEIANEMTAQSAEAQWAAAIKRQFVAAKGQGVDYETDEEKRSDLDGFVRSLGANPKNADKSMDWFMAEAHKRVLALHDIKTASAPAAAPAAATPAAPAADPSKTRKPPVAAVTPSLSNVPGGDGPGDVGGDEFADIDSLDGFEFEAALSRMSESQRAKYLARA